MTGVINTKQVSFQAFKDVAFERRPDGSEGARLAMSRQRGDSECKGPEVTASFDMATEKRPM